MKESKRMFREKSVNSPASAVLVGEAKYRHNDNFSIQLEYLIYTGKID